MNKKQTLTMLNNKKVRKECINLFTIEDNEDLKQSIIDSLKDNNCTIEDFEETEDHYSIKGYQNFWMKSKLKKVEEGILKVRTNDYIFLNSENKETFGSIPKLENMILLENGFITVKKWINENEYKGIKYTLVEGDQ